ncbi:MAG: DUF1566 domain-containing protein [Paludibacteraceae bacterium]|nr:DUF1566 domain-containing protein [Paludibacteraceae bacterium]
MKKILFPLALIALVTACQPKPEPDPVLTENGYEYIDLGLSVKWATMNVGAAAPEDFGYYVAWGETKNRETDTYDWAHYAFANGSGETLTKYCSNPDMGNNGFTDNKVRLDKEDDLAAVAWGGKWRMPTQEEMQELIDRCTWTFTTLGANKGYQVVGPSGKSIFLPAGGEPQGSIYFGKNKYGHYWTSTNCGANSSYSWALYMAPDAYTMPGGNYRCSGFSVRPVL